MTLTEKIKRRLQHSADGLTAAQIARRIRHDRRRTGVLMRELARRGVVRIRYTTPNPNGRGGARLNVYGLTEEYR